MPKTMAAAANNNTNIEDTIDSREFIANPRKVIAEKLFSAYGFKSLSAATSSALEPIDGDWNLSKVLKKSISESEEEERDAKKTTKWLSIPEINHADGKSVGIESVPEGKLCRFRCVVQDMRDPEYYVGCFKSKRASSGWQTTKFAEHGGDETSRMEEEDEEEGEEKDKNDDEERLFTFENPREQSSNVRMWERKVFYCVPIPGEAKWVQERDCLEREDTHANGDGVVDFTSIGGNTGASVGGGSAKKRTREENNEEEKIKDDKEAKMKEEKNEPAKSEDTMEAMPINGSQKTEDFTAMNNKNRNKSVARETLDEARNLPLPNDQRGPCIVCVYDSPEDDEGDKENNNNSETMNSATITNPPSRRSSTQLKLNDIVEFYGVLSLNPEHAAEAFGNIGLNDSIEEDNDGATTTQPSDDDFYGHAERAALFPASSIAPRFHAFGFTKLKLEDLVLKTPAERYLLDEEENVKEASASVSVVRPFDAATTNAMCEKMIDTFTEALGGDKVAASYALFLACARIRLRTDEFPVGSLCVNFSIDCALSKVDGESKRKRNDNLVNALASALQSLCPATACLSVDVPSLNARTWVPKKDYDRNRLRAGPLQLADGTVCVLDETKLQTGILAETGVKNARAVKDIIQMQKVEYDFDYHQMSMPTDISFVAVSEGKSILFSEDTEGLVVPLRPTKNESNTALLHALDKQTLDDMRTLVAFVRNAPHMDISESCGKTIEASMVQKRQDDPKEATQAKMHSWLTMSRLQSLLKGRNEITVDSWEEIMELERTVKNRRRVL
jgi:hypothetical protein